MKRRDSLKAITLSSLGFAGMNPQISAAESLLPPDVKPLKVPGGRQKFEAERDAKLNADKFFTPHELRTVTVLGDIIIPADARSGSASQSGTPAFIEFMMKDQPQWQTPIRGGFRWLDNQCVKRFEKKFADCLKAQQLEIIDEIAYPGKAKPEMSQGCRFFQCDAGFGRHRFFHQPDGHQRPRLRRQHAQPMGGCPR
jgi:gluconate 2-dehydrogenase gamma chain